MAVTAPIAYYKLDESSGNASDATGGRTLTNNNTATFATGKINNGADLERDSSQFFDRSSDDFGIGAQSDFSFQAWVNFESIPTSNSTYWNILSRTVNNADDISYNLDYRQEAGVKSIQFNNINYVTTLSTSTWYHLVYTNDYGGTERLYINGTEVATATGSTSTTGFSAVSYFGLGIYRDGNGNILSRYFDGVIDEVGLWNVVLSSSEVTELYNSGNGKAYPFGTAYTLALDQGAYTYTGYATLFRLAWKFLVEQGSYAYTGFATGLSKGYGIICAAGSYILTGIETVLRYGGWTNQSKNSSTFSNSSKNTSTFTNNSKNSSSWTNQSKS